MASLLAGIPYPQPVDFGRSFDAGRQAVWADQRTQRADQRDKNLLIAQYAANADTPEKWAAAMSDLQRAGVPDAADFASRFDLRETLIDRAYSAADQMNSRTAGEFLGSLGGTSTGAGTLSSLGMPQTERGPSLDPRYLASLPPQGAALPVGGGIPSRPNTDAPAQPYTVTRGPGPSDNIAALRPAMAAPGLNAALGGNGMPAPLPGPMNRPALPHAQPLRPVAGGQPTGYDSLDSAVPGLNRGRPIAGTAGFDAMTGGAGMDVLGDAKLPPSLIQAESRGQQFDRNGRPTESSKGAIGIAQVMPGTAPEAAQLAGVPFDEWRYRNDPAYNEMIGAAYYDAQYRKYGDEALAAAAYNAGPGRVDEYLSSGRPLPAETIDYVRKVTGRNLGAGGGAVRPGTRDIQAPVPNGVPLSSLQILGRNPTYAGTAIEAAMGQFAPRKPTEGVVINGRLVNPTTGDVMGDYRSAEAMTVPLTPEQAQALGFQPGTIVQRKADGSLDVVQKPEGTAGGPFDGTSLDAQDSNILLRGDPASPEYAMAYQRQYMTPKPVQIPDPNNPGAMMMGYVQVSPPPQIRPPAGMGQQPAPPPGQTGEQPQQAAPQPGGSVSVQGIPGTSKLPNTPIAAEVAGRIGLANQFLDNDLPGIRQAIQGGAMNGVLERGQLAFGAGEPGRLYGRIQAGVDALRRNLTGAGMNNSEIDEYVGRYLPTTLDGSDNMLLKLAALEADLKATRDAVLAGRNPIPELAGKSKDRPNTLPSSQRDQQAPEQVAAPKSETEYNALPSGALYIHPDDPTGSPPRRKQ